MAVLVLRWTWLNHVDQPSVATLENQNETLNSGWKVDLFFGNHGPVDHRLLFRRHRRVQRGRGHPPRFRSYEFSLKTKTHGCGVSRILLILRYLLIGGFEPKTVKLQHPSSHACTPESRPGLLRTHGTLTGAAVLTVSLRQVILTLLFTQRNNDMYLYMYHARRWSLKKQLNSLGRCFDQISRNVRPRSVRSRDMRRSGDLGEEALGEIWGGDSKERSMGACSTWQVTVTEMVGQQQWHLTQEFGSQKKWPKQTVWSCLIQNGEHWSCCISDVQPTNWVHSTNPSFCRRKWML